MFEQLSDGVAEFEKDLLRERVRTGIAAARKRDVVFGRRLGQRVKSDRPAPKVLLSALLLAVWTPVVTSSIAQAAVAAPQPFDPKPWLEDLEQTREAIATQYANLEWLVLEREVDVSAVFSEARAQVQSASSDLDERAALGYHKRIRGGVTAAFVPGYSPLADTSGNEFPAGTTQVSGHRVGVIKIGIFTPEGMPELCTESITALKISTDAVCDEICKDHIDSWVTDRMTRDFEAQLHAIESARADVLLIDIANNGGGTEWAEAVARIVTAVRLKSERIGFVRGPHWAKQFADTVANLRVDAKGASRKDADMFNGLAEQVLGYQRQAETPCDSQPLWEGNRAAIVMGAPTVGAGCGHTNGGTPTTLKNSGGILEMPDCARMRSDGSNEVMGIQPDVLVGLRTTDGPHRQGVRVAEKLPEAVARAIGTGTDSVRHH